MKPEKDRQKIYDILKDIVSKYEPEMKVLSDFGSRYELAATGEYEVTSERTGKTTGKKEPFFAGVIIQSNYVGLYLTAPYTDLDNFQGKEIEDAMSLLKGKSCFHVKYLDDEMISQIEELVRMSYQLFEEKGWL